MPCRFPSIARPSFYYWKEHHEEQESIKQALFAEEIAFAAIVMDAWVLYPTCGYLKISFHIQRKKHPETTEKHVKHIYKVFGLSPVFKTTRKSKRKEKEFSSLLRNQEISFGYSM